MQEQTKNSGSMRNSNINFKFPKFAFFQENILYMSTQEDYEKFRAKLAHMADFIYATTLMKWDQEVNMPPEGNPFRARQIATLSVHQHNLFTSGEFEELVNRLAEDNSLGFKEKKNVLEAKRELVKEKKLPGDFVGQFNKTVSECYHSWIKARQENDFSRFAPDLKKIVEFNRKKAELTGYEDHPYDALLDDFEPRLTIRETEKVFRQARDHLTVMLQKIREKPDPASDFLNQTYDRSGQIDLCREIAKDLGYDFEAGRLDLSEHPFTTAMSPADTRITTRIPKKNFQGSLWSAIHETGHALYEQGIPGDEYGLPSGKAISLGIHESQSRLWENHIGKSRTFIRLYFQRFREYFPDQLSGVNDEDLYKAINRVKPGYIRTEADELSYHLHIIIRYEIEKALIEEDLAVEDLKDAWNQKYRDYLGLETPDDKNGILQDIHWSHGTIGYFPTYSLGSFYAAQFFRQAQKEISGLEESLEKKDFRPLLQWLREKIHRHGRLYQSNELCEKITGKPLDFSFFRNYTEKKYNEIYGL